jgi:NitT/TauT family transport system substrate-binding protein
MNRRTFLTAVPALGLLAACGKTSKTRLALNWKPDPQFGGFYAAPYLKHALDIEILPGGAGTPTVQMIGAGSAEFGIVSADELVIARSRGNDVVTLFATFQDCPQGIMVHASRNLASIGDVFKEGTVALQRGLPYARILEKKYGFDHVKIVPSPGGDISAFLHDEKFAQQCFVMDEPLGAKRNGVAVKVFPVADAGYNPYTTVLATSGDMLKKDVEKVQAMVAAVREGWRIYLDNPMSTNERMRELNPTLDNNTITEVAEAQKPYIETDETRRSGLGVMTGARWEMLVSQLKELGDIQQPVSPQDCFKLFVEK